MYLYNYNNCVALLQALWLYCLSAHVVQSTCKLCVRPMHCEIDLASNNLAQSVLGIDRDPQAQEVLNEIILFLSFFTEEDSRVKFMQGLSSSATADHHKVNRATLYDDLIPNVSRPN